MRSQQTLAVIGLALAFGSPTAALADADHPAHEEPPATSSKSQHEIWKSGPGRDLNYASMRRFVLPLNHPAVVGAADAEHMRDDDLVLGVVVEGEARAYPWWILTKYHVANDAIGKHPVFVAICEVCTGGAAFSPVVEGHFLSFQLCGLKHGSFEVCDWETSSRWIPFKGESYEGPLAGTRLEQLPFVYLNWGDWKTEYPNSTVVLGGDELRARAHGIQSPPGAKGIARALRNTLDTLDPRLESNELVFGLVPEKGGKGKAYPLSRIREHGGVVQDEVDGRPVLVILRGELGASAFVRRIGEKTLHLERVSIHPIEMREKETGARWTAVGTEFKSGKFAAAKLPMARGYVTEWYEWASNYPSTEIAE
jgi:hypothetical protein